MDFVNCTYESHSIEILEILNEVILNSTALYDYEPRTMESMTMWFSNKEKGNFPIIGRTVDLSHRRQSYLTAAAQIQFCIALEKLHELFRRQNPW